MNRNSPCLTCTRVRDPQNCENKTCRDWQAWFIRRWEALRETFDKAGIHPQAPLPKAEKSRIPHREDSREDPCTSCPCGHCQVPCTDRIHWENEKGDRT